jgi:hypothetical protein
LASWRVCAVILAVAFRYETEGLSADKRRVIETFNRFHEALESGQIPQECLRGAGASAAGHLSITIFPDDPAFREAIARWLPEDAYRIKVQDVRATPA